MIRFRRTWLIPAALLLLSCLAWTLLSFQFHYGQGHQERPILEYLFFYLVAWAAFLWGVMLLRKSAGKGPLHLILAVALLSRALLLPSNPILENDFYRYVLDGQLLLRGLNPYQYSPLVLEDFADPSLRAELDRPEVRQVLSRVGHPEVATVYPPASQLAFAAGAWLGGWNWKGLRWTFLAWDLMALFLLLYLLSQLGLNRAWCLLYAWNPLVLKEVTNSIHMDVLVALAVLVVLAALHKYQGSGHKAWLAVSGVAIGAGILCKFYPLLLVPACLLFAWRHSRSALSALVLLASSMLTVLLGYLPFLSIGLDRLTSGLLVYTQRWEMNEGAFAVLSYITPHARLLAAVIVMAAAVTIPLLRKSDSTISLAGDFLWILLLWFLLLPAPFPWYALALAALAGLRPQSGAALVTVVLAGAGALYYLSFYYQYHGYAEGWWTATRTLEHLVPWLGVLASAWPFLRNLVTFTRPFQTQIVTNKSSRLLRRAAPKQINV